MNGVAVGIGGQPGEHSLDMRAGSLLVVRGLVTDLSQPGRALAGRAVASHVDDCWERVLTRNLVTTNATAGDRSVAVYEW